MPEPFLAVKSVSVAYGTARSRCQALRDVSIEFDKGCLTLIMGPSGSGKTTLLSLLGCLLTPDAGEVYLDGAKTNLLTESERTRLRRDRIGFVFQAFRLFRSLSALDNVTVAAEATGRAPSRTMALKLLKELDLESRASMKPDALSGGEKQRVAIARALVNNPSIVLADEPTASLDAAAGQQVSKILLQLAEDHGRAVVVVSHDPRWLAFAHRVVTLDDGQVVEQRSTTA